MKERNIGLDLLRILLAIAVITIHFNATGTGHVSSSIHWLPMKFVVYGVDSIVLPAVNVYVIMSGYFSYRFMRSYKHVIRSLIRLWLCLEFFSLFGLVIASESITFETIIKRMFPIATGEWWYMSVYFTTMLMSPMLNKTVDTLNKKDSLFIILIMILTCSIIPFFTKNEEPLGVNLGYSLIWFLILYYTGAVLCKYFSNIQSKYFLWIFFVLCFACILVGNIASKIDVLKGYGLSTYNSITLYIQAIVIFFYFKNLTFKSVWLKNSISYLAGLSLAAYIFHCQKDIGTLIWTKLSPSQYADTLFLIPVYLVTVISIYVLSVIIEIARRRLFGIAQIESVITNKMLYGLEILWIHPYKRIEKLES